MTAAAVYPTHLRGHVIPVELGLREGSDVVSHLLPGCYGQLHQPLHHGVDVDEVQPLDLMGLQTVGTFHARKDRHDLLGKATA